MPERVLTLAPADVVLKRVAAELGAAASELAAVEAHVAALIGHGLVDLAETEQLQALDRINQQLRALEAFLYAAAPLAEDRIDLTSALRSVSLERVRSRLAGSTSHATAPSAPELW
jgi:hypothetical protein